MNCIRRSMRDLRHDLLHERSAKNPPVYENFYEPSRFETGHES